MDRNPRDNTIEERIADACRGLTLMSETDAPVEPFIDGPSSEVTAAAVRSAADIEPHINANVSDAAAFFDRLTAEREWYTTGQKRDARRFAALEELLRKELADLQMFRFGRIRISIYVVGRDSEGRLAGIKTMAVET